MTRDVDARELHVCERWIADHPESAPNRDSVLTPPSRIVTTTNDLRIGHGVRIQIHLVREIGVVQIESLVAVQVLSVREGASLLSLIPL